MSDPFCSFHSANSNNNSHAPPKISSIVLPFNHHVAHASEQGTSNNMQPQPSSRWSPTPVQLLLLEELFRQGMKTPSADQIEQIALHLRQHGKIEGKNVFYWFQNHKARERQKRRRQEMEAETASSTEDKKQKEKYVMENSEKQEVAGLKETGCGVKETKKWASTSNCSEQAEELTTALDIVKKGARLWAQFEERDIQVLRKNIAAENFMPISTPPPIIAPQNFNIRENCINSEEENEDPRTLNLFPH